MNIPPFVAADLALLTEVLDASASDVAATLSGLVAEVTGSLPSFVGLSVLVGDHDTRVQVTTIKDPADAALIRTSLRFRLLGEARHDGPATASGVLVVYAAQPGALVDLAADLAWLTARPLSDARLDEDLDGPVTTSREGSLTPQSTVNQALGVLMGDGLTKEEAGAELDARAAANGVESHLAAAEILASLPGRREGPGAEDS